MCGLGARGAPSVPTQVFAYGSMLGLSLLASFAVLCFVGWSFYWSRKSTLLTVDSSNVILFDFRRLLRYGSWLASVHKA